jgi:hypothetical protein
MTLVDLSHLQGDLDPVEPTWTTMRPLIEDAIVNDPRSLQTRIGPSEIGTSCDACLVSKLGGIREKRDGGAWLPTVGRAVHEWLETVTMMANGDRARWLLETTVSVGTVGGVDITGHADLFDLRQGEVVDWKITGANTLKKAKPCLRDPARAATVFPSYHVQRHLYGYGFTRRGLAVRTVTLAFLPRNAPSLRDAIVLSEPYNEAVAVAAIARADMFAAAIGALGLDAVLAATGGHTGEEFSCSRFDDSIAGPGHHPKTDQLAGLVAPQTPSPTAAGSTAA